MRFLRKDEHAPWAMTDLEWRAIRGIRGSHPDDTPASIRSSERDEGADDPTR